MGEAISQISVIIFSELTVFLAILTKEFSRRGAKRRDDPIDNSVQSYAANKKFN